MTAKYDPLRIWLNNHTSDRIRVSFREMEAILGFELPPSARTRPQWWANAGGSHVQAAAWMDAGRRARQLDLSGEQVTFESAARRPSPTRQSGGVAEAAAPFLDDAIVIRIAALRGGVMRMLEDYRDAHGGNLADAATGLLNEAGLARRRQLLDWVRANAPKVSDDSTDLIREDRDSR